MAKLVIDANRKLSKINKEIQGQFSEHLGRCIYEGLYVGENSDIPNVNGMRTDVVEALKNIKVPRAAEIRHTTGRVWSATPQGGAAGMTGVSGEERMNASMGEVCGWKIVMVTIE